MTKKKWKPIACPKCKLECLKLGLKVSIDSTKFIQSEIFCGPYCYHHDRIDAPTQIALSRDILLSEHICQMQEGQTHSVEGAIENHLSSSKICSLVDFYLCVELIANPEYWPNYAQSQSVGFFLAIFLLRPP